MTYTEEKTDKFVSGVTNISYFSGFFKLFEGSHVNVRTEEKISVKLACIHILDKDEGNREMHLMLKNKMMKSLYPSF